VKSLHHHFPIGYNDITDATIYKVKIMHSNLLSLAIKTVKYKAMWKIIGYHSSVKETTDKSKR